MTLNKETTIGVQHQKSKKLRLLKKNAMKKENASPPPLKTHIQKVYLTRGPPLIFFLKLGLTK